MLTRRGLIAGGAALLAAPRAAAAREPAVVRVRIVTPVGAIIVALDARRAPATTANFLAYVDDERFDGTRFYRAARSKKIPGTGFIQGGIQTDARRILPPFAFEPTTKTGLRHVDGAISMARGANPKSAGGNWVICVGPAPQLDGREGYLGYAAFGRVIAGMAVAKRILAVPTGGGFDAMKGQMILRPIPILRVERIDGVRKPTGRPRMWLLFKKR
ncbi:peptidylprolyl isomerase [Sphingomonas spermidinifaciens]|uniref:peptidylprolyl isomerase n=1 Tax=Sphingomonas spermidinifaciens TaxID=1141889 RepID=A0A2A4B0Q0_9SPHN|nr:peptidylprolyl isomerase [Sphingomonas spermidinifaciens]